MKIEMVDVNLLSEPSWHATHILRPDMVALAASLGQYGIVSPLIVQRKSNTVIDGVQRMRVIKGNKAIAETFPEGVPVNYIDCDDLDAMILHAQINRGRGQIVAKRLSTIVKKLKRSGRLNDADFDRLFCMKYDELELLLDGSMIKHRDIANYNYSRAWVPVEAPPGTVEAGPISIDRPPNQDR